MSDIIFEDINDIKEEPLPFIKKFSKYVLPIVFVAVILLIIYYFLPVVKVDDWLVKHSISISDATFGKDGSFWGESYQIVESKLGRIFFLLVPIIMAIWGIVLIRSPQALFCGLIALSCGGIIGYLAWIPAVIKDKAAGSSFEMTTSYYIAIIIYIIINVISIYTLTPKKLNPGRDHPGL